MTRSEQIAALAAALVDWRKVYVDPAHPQRWHVESAEAILAALEAAGLTIAPRDDLGAAWEAAEAALPNDLYMDFVLREYDGEWVAGAARVGEPHDGEPQGRGDTPAAALLALAVALTEREK